MEIVFVLFGFVVFCIYMAVKTTKKKTTSESALNTNVTVKMTTSSSRHVRDDGLEENEQVSPIPFDDREKLFVSDERYYVVWSGKSPEATFSVNRKDKVTMTPTHVLMKDEKIHVAEIKGDDTKIIPTLDISSQIQVKGHNRRSFWEWMRIINPNFPWNFYRAYPEHETCDRDYSVVWEGELAPTTFSRYVYNGNERNRKRETVTPLSVLKGKLTGETKIKFRDSQDREFTIKVDLIDTMLATEGHKKMHFDDWVNEVLLAQTKLSKDI
ncbi:hypothetical protein ONZ70_003608 [Vibrio fluvialis]|uniref:hypothetical protein n=1 Tax=Vibrio fluvialis TaxID=676 RepID=UPI001F377581|nr:hypothetical protein [Vibrio fluvialis]EKO3378399.1 hypothetical protein [Vibrio fluvialis]MCE7654713.1 hypothetical protein [Vibrio fluvialis]MCG6373409.1 hypothetical protein [Vibrio fluvialis]